MGCGNKQSLGYVNMSNYNKPDYHRSVEIVLKTIILTSSVSIMVLYFWYDKFENDEFESDKFTLH